MSGLVALPKIKSKYPEIKVIMFSTYYDKLFILDAFSKGAASFMPKNSMLNELEMAIKLVYTNGFYHTEYVEKVLEQNERHNKFQTD
jgi:DNA-binding NarL/FixJ family response regulator